MARRRHKKERNAITHGLMTVWLVILTVVVIVLLVVIQERFQPRKIAQAFSNTAVPEAWVADGTVESVESSATTTYIGGSFDYVGEYTATGVAIDATTGEIASANLPRPDGNPGNVHYVHSALSDGSGGWYIGGSFADINEVAHRGIAHIFADGTMDTSGSWSSTFLDAGQVNAMSLSGSTLYIGGTFTSINGTARNRVAAIDTTNGSLLSWNPNANGTVSAIATRGSVVYLGGSFTTIGGTGRNRIAAVDATTAVLDAVWNPNAANAVEDIVVKADGSVVYAGGTFTTIGGTANDGLAALQPANGVNTGTADASWFPNPQGTVDSIALNAAETVLYAGGSFANMDGVAALDQVAAVDATVDFGSALDTGNAFTLWDPDPGTNINAVAVATSGTTVYIGGGFTSLGTTNEPRERIGSVSADPTVAATVTSWDPHADQQVLAIAPTATQVFVGGQFDSIGGEDRRGLAAFDNTTRDVTSFCATTCDLNGSTTATAMVLDGTTLYIGGTFTSVGGTARNRIAAIDTTTSTLTSFNPNSNNQIEDFALDGTSLYVGGWQATIGGQTRRGIAEIDTTTGLATSWNPLLAVGDQVFEVEIDADNVYIGGNFTAATTQSNIAKIDRATGAVDATWDDVTLGGVVQAMGLDDANDTLYFAGQFSQVDGQSREVFAITTTDGQLTSFDMPHTGSEHILLVDGPSIYLGGGGFTTCGSPVQTRKGGCSFDSAGNLTGWNPNTSTVSTSVLDIERQGTDLHIAGSITVAGDRSRHGYAVYSINQIQFQSATSSVGEATTPANLTLTLDAIDSEDITVDYAVTGGSASGSGVDYTLASGTATITSGNLTTSIPVTIVNDSIDEGPETVEVTLTNQSANALLGAQTVHTLTITDNDTAGVTITETGGSTDVTEGFNTDTYSAVLTSQPTDDVTITPTVTGGQVTVAPPSLTFTSLNWSTPQDFTVTAIDDAAVEGNHGDSITHAATSADLLYQGISIASVTVNIADNDSPGVVVTESVGSTDVVEGSTTDTYDVVLTTLPTDDVTITPSVTGGQVTVAPPSLTFTTSNYSVAQTFTVTAVDDAIVEGPHGDTITHSATSTDTDYNGIAVNDVTVNIGDNDTAGVMVVQSDGTTVVTEGGATDTITVQLTSQPTATVTITLTFNSGELNLSSATLNFDGTNWSTPQPVTVTAVDDTIVESTETYDITFTVTSADGAYNALSVAPVSVSITDNDVPPPPEPEPTDNVTVISGDSPEALAISVSQVKYPTPGSADCALFARKDVAVDMFTAIPFVSIANCTVLLTDSAFVSANVLAELDRALGDASKLIYLAGGTTAITPTVDLTLDQQGYKNRSRFAGTTRHHTAKLLADAVVAKNTGALRQIEISEDSALVDALTIGAAAGSVADGIAEPILVTARAGTQVDQNIVDFLRANPSIRRAEIIGGLQAVSGEFETKLRQLFPDISITRRAGRDRYETNRAIIEHYFPEPTTVYVSRGDTSGIPGAIEVRSTAPSIYTALFASALAAQTSSPTTLITGTSIPGPIRDYLTANAPTIESAVVVTDISQIPQELIDEIERLIQ